MTKSLEHLQKHLNCYKCNSPKIDYEANDHQQRITFICQQCQWSITASYLAARRYGFEPVPELRTAEVVVLNNEGEIASRFQIKPF
ncbi:hypothetical protein FACHB389_06755 [Nostoc calcicola FACHB-389]|nr:hypothetical protein [Nostoc calcicola FACHB-3891]OKH40697.1 hypothetical protein FACHB389_06755 [Nostoc calcicola FACHB-389]